MSQPQQTYSSVVYLEVFFFKIVENNCKNMFLVEFTVSVCSLPLHLCSFFLWSSLNQPSPANPKPFYIIQKGKNILGLISTRGQCSSHIVTLSYRSEHIDAYLRRTSMYFLLSNVVTWCDYVSFYISCLKSNESKWTYLLLNILTNLKYKLYQ